MNNDPIPDFILNNQNDYSNGVNTFGGQSSNDPIPDFIKNQEEDIVVSPKRNLKDEEVKTQLGVDFDDSFSSDSKQVKEYVDSLSDDDYELRDQRREEGYSLDARKALMDNKELVNREPGNLKYKINSLDLGNRALNYIQNLNEGYEKIHPWNKSAQEWLDEATMFMEEKLGKENLMNQRIDKHDPYSKMGPKAAEQTINSYETFVNLVQIPKILGQTLTYSSSRILNAIDQIQNLKASIPAEIVDLYQKIQGKEPIFNIQYDEERSNPIGSSIQIIKDGLGVGFVIAYPVATYLMSLLGSTNQDIQNVEEKVYNKVEGLFQYLLSLDGAQNLIEIAGLNAKDEESLVEGLTDGLFLIGGALAPKLFKNKTVELHKEAFKQANNFAKKYGKYKTREGFAAKEAAGQLPVGSEILNKKGKPIAVSTSEGGRFTTRGALETGLQGVKGYAEMFKNYWKWFYQNYNKRNVNRNPYAPVGELPNIVGTETQTGNPTKVVEEEKVKEELTPERETEVKEKGFYTDEEPIVKTPKKVTPKESGVSIGEFIKKNINKITGKKGGLNEDLANKLQTSKDLQNEYVNTIDPYIRENGTNNPGGVIQEQLNSLVDSVKDKIIERKVNNQIFRRGQKQYKVEITEEEKKNQKIEDEKLKKLLKAMEKQSDSPEELLKYLLNLPKETVDEFNKMIPDFSQNLSLIKDTLDITKAITSSDLLGKFLKFKSTWGTRNKNFIRKYLYKKLYEAYTKVGIKRNMYEVEEMLNKMSEDQLIELEKSIEEGKDLPNFIKQDFLDQFEYALDRERWIKQSENNGPFPIKGTGPDAAREALIKQGYKNPKTNTPFKTQEEIENYVLPNGKTIKQFLTDINYDLEHKYSINPGLQGAADLVERTIEYYGDIDKLPEYGLQHELGHIFLSSLTTAEYLDLVEGFTKATKSLKKYDPNLNISEYKSLAKSEVGATEFIPDSIGLFLTYMDINGMGDYLQPYLSPKLGSKVKKILNGVGKDLRDEFSSVEVNGKKFTPSKEVERLSDRGLNDKEFQTRTHNDIDPKYNNGVGYKNRLADWQKIDPNVVYFKWDLDIKSDNFGKMIIRLKDGSKLTREEYKNTLTTELREKLYENREIKNIENEDSLSEYRKNRISGDKQLAEFWSSNDGLSKYKEDIRNIDPDIVGLKEKDGQIYVKYLIESQRERYELPDRPGYVEVKEVPAKDYFTEEELNQLPKKLKEMISADKK